MVDVLSYDGERVIHCTHMLVDTGYWWTRQIDSRETGKAATDNVEDA